MKTPKIVFIGAGSMSFGTSMFRDIFSSPLLFGATLSLVDINPENLERMYKLAVKMNEASGLNINIEKSIDRTDLLPNADFVVTSVAIERCELWKHDFEIPKKHGIRHSYQLPVNQCLCNLFIKHMVTKQENMATILRLMQWKGLECLKI